MLNKQQNKTKAIKYNIKLPLSKQRQRLFATTFLMMYHAVRKEMELKSTEYNMNTLLAYELFTDVKILIPRTPFRSSHNTLKLSLLMANKVVIKEEKVFFKVSMYVYGHKLLIL